MKNKNLKKENELKKNVLLTYEKVDQKHIHNILGFETIEIIVFNYDGQSTALVYMDDELDTPDPETLKDVLFGFPDYCETDSSEVPRIYKLKNNG